MIDFIITTGLFIFSIVIIGITLFFTVIGLILLGRWVASNLLNIIIVISTIAGLTLGGIKLASADSIDVTYFTYLSTPAIEADKSNMAIGYTLDMTDSTSIKAGVMDNKSSSLYVMFKARKKYKYISYGISAGFMPNIKTEVVNYLSPKYDGKHISFERKSYVSTEVNEMALTVMPSVSFYYEKHAIELGYSPKLNDYEESRYMAQYQYSF